MATRRAGREALEFSDLQVRQQPDDVTCGPTCLQAIYAFYGLDLGLDEVIGSVRKLDHGGTLGVLLGLDALERGFDVQLFTYNLEIFDPTWFHDPRPDLRDRLRRQAVVKTEPRLRKALESYLAFVEAGGRVDHRELTSEFLEEIVNEGTPPITGLSATYLYDCAREVFADGHSRFDDVAGEPVGHFVVISGFDPESGRFRISDPSQDNPRHGSGTYWVRPSRLIGALFLGATTYDGNLVIIRPKPEAMQ